jgi:hypothetical protein
VVRRSHDFTRGPRGGERLRLAVLIEAPKSSIASPP